MTALSPAVATLIKAFSDKAKDLSPVGPEVTEIALASIDQNFRLGGRFGAGPLGGGAQKWTPSRRAKEQGGKTLVDTARLASSIQARFAGNTLTVGTNLIYARIHDEGGTIKPKKGKYLKFSLGKGKGWRVVSKVTIPERPYLVLQDEDVDDIIEAVLAYLST